MNFGTQKPSSVRSGFTLLELLVVIAIISLLAAILFPVFSRARENARRSTCQSNLKQIGLGMFQYAQDADEHFTYANAGWAGRIYPYVKSTQIFTCPSDTARATAPNTEISYAWSSVGVAVGSAINLSQFTAPAKTVMCHEVSGAFFDPSNPNSDGIPAGIGSIMDQTGGEGNVRGGNTGAPSIRVYATGTMGQRPASTNNLFYPQENMSLPPLEGRHLQGANFLAYDGHVKWMHGDSVSTGANAKAADCDQDGGSGTGNAKCGAAGSSANFAAGTSGRINGTDIGLTFSSM